MLVVVSCFGYVVCGGFVVCVAGGDVAVGVIDVAGVVYVHVNADDVVAVAGYAVDNGVDVDTAIYVGVTEIVWCCLCF